MDPGFDNLESSLKFEDSLLGQSGTIDTLCHTYLANMDSFPPAGASSTRGGYGRRFQEDVKTHTFSSRDVREWDGEDCLEWAESVCAQLGLDRTSLDLWSFKSTSGTNLLQLSQENFSQLLGPRFGQVFYSQLHALSGRKGTGKNKSRRRLQEAEDSSTSLFTSAHDVSAVGTSYDPSSTSYDYSGASCDPTSSSYDPDSWELTSEDFKELDRYIPDDSWDPLTEDLEGLDLQEQFMPIKYEEETWAAAASATSTVTAPTPTPETDVFQKIPTNTRRRERGPKSWEFLLRLLEDRRSNPTLIRWEDEFNGTFRLVQPNVIAQMWGARSEKPNLSYFNFARGLRYHYSTGALLPVSEKQLVYRCGPKAIKYRRELKERGLN